MASELNKQMDQGNFPCEISIGNMTIFAMSIGSICTEYTHPPMWVKYFINHLALFTEEINWV